MAQARQVIVRWNYLDNTGNRRNAAGICVWADMHLQTDGTTKLFIESKGILCIIVKFIEL